MKLFSFRRWRRLLIVVAVAVAMTGGWLTSGPVGVGSAATPTLTWSTLSPPLSPPPLAYASMAYDNDNATIVLFGGQQADGTLSSDTWVWNGSTWSRYSSAVPARKLASMAFDPALHQLILFGGQGGGNQLLNDTWAWNGASWVAQAPGIGTSPPAREGAGLGFDSNDQLVLFGGSGAAGVTPFASRSGAGAPAASAPPSAPSAGPTSGPDTAVVADATPLVTLGDTWVWTGSTWSQQAVGGPVARTDAAMTWDGAHHQTVLFGGSTSPVGAAPPSGMLADTWIWGNGAWIPTTPPISPSPRLNTTVVADGDLGGLVAFGGGTPSGPGNDTWVWNGQTWAQLSPTASPTARQGAAAAYDIAAHQLVLFGGVSAGGPVLGDTKILTAKAPAMPGSSPAAPGPGGSLTAPGATAGPATSATTRGFGPTSGLQRPARASGAVTPSQKNAREVRRGDLVTLSGSGFKANAPITITFHSAPYLVGRTVANGAGVFSATVAVPTAAAPGLHHFEATGMGVSGVMISLATPVDVIDAIVHHRALVETLVLVAVAIALPVGTWLVMGIGWRRRDVPAVA